MKYSKCFKLSICIYAESEEEARDDLIMREYTADEFECEDVSEDGTPLTRR